MIFGSLKTDHWLFCVIDGFIYAVIFLLLVETLRASLRLLARHEADYRRGKCFVTTLVILLSAATATTVPYAERVGVFILLPIVLLGAAILRLLCWAPLGKGLWITMILAAAAVGSGAGTMALANRVLPKGRITLVGRLKVSVGILDNLAGRPGESIIPTNFFQNVNFGLRLQGESFVSAVALLKDPQALERMTAAHTDDLKALGLILDGEKLTPEQLAGIGIVYDKAQPGIGVLQGVSTTNAISEQDVRDVVSLLRSVRKDGSEVTVNDAVIVIREAMKRRQAFLPAANDLLTEKTSGAGGEAPGSLTPVSATATAETGAASMPVCEVETAAVGRAEGKAAAPPVRDPLNALGAAERAAWESSKTGLVVTAVLTRSGGNSLAMVNGEMVHTGDVVSVALGNRTYCWRLARLNARRLIWEPVLGARNEDESTFIPLR